MFKDVAEFKQAHKAQGGHFFDPQAMRFFNSKIESGLVGQRDQQVFITSERQDLDRPKKYTIRHAMPSGEVREVGDFQEFDTLEQALYQAGLRQVFGAHFS